MIFTSIAVVTLLVIFFSYSSFKLITYSFNKKSEWELKQDYKGPKIKGSVAIPLSFNGEDYYSNLVVGTPRNGETEQVLRCYFSTTTQNLWVAGVEGCKAKDCSDQTIKPFNATKSSTYKYLKRRMTHSFTRFKVVKGRVSRDNVKIATDGQNSLEITGHLFGEADDFSDMFNNHEAVYGLSLISPDLFYHQPEPPVWSLTKRFTNPVFGFYLNTPTSGKLLLGGGDEGLYEGQLESHEVYAKEKYYMGWLIKVDRVYFDDPKYATVTKPEGKVMLAQVDSGSPLIEGPLWAIDRINEAIFQSMGVPYTSHKPETGNPDTFRCDKNTLSSLPTVIFSITGKDYKLRPWDYLSRDKGKQQCKTKFQAAYTPHFQLGHVFMKKYYTKFDVGNKRIMFAKMKREKQPKQPRTSGTAGSLMQKLDKTESEPIDSLFDKK